MVPALPFISHYAKPWGEFAILVDAKETIVDEIPVRVIDGARRSRDEEAYIQKLECARVQSKAPEYAVGAELSNIVSKIFGIVAVQRRLHSTNGFEFPYAWPTVKRTSQYFLIDRNTIGLAIFPQRRNQVMASIGEISSAGKLWIGRLAPKVLRAKSVLGKQCGST